MKKSIILFISVIFIVSCKQNSDVAPGSNVVRGFVTDQTSNDKNLTDAIVSGLNGIKSGFLNASTSLGIVTLTCATINYKEFGYTNTKTITYSYDKPCSDSGVVKLGEIRVILQNDSSFEAKDAVYTVEFKKFSITINGKSGIKDLDGTFTVTNTSGGNAWAQKLNPKNGVPRITVTELIKGQAKCLVSIAGEVISSQFAYKTTTYRDTLTWSMTLDGDTSVNEIKKVMAWGNGRDGITYYKTVTQPYSFTRTCGLFRPTSGKSTTTLVKGDGSKYSINAASILNTTGCGSGFTLAVADDKKNTWNYTVGY